MFSSSTNKKKKCGRMPPTIVDTRETIIYKKVSSRCGHYFRSWKQKKNNTQTPEGCFSIYGHARNSGPEKRFELTGREKNVRIYRVRLRFVVCPYWNTCLCWYVRVAHFAIIRFTIRIARVQWRQTKGNALTRCELYGTGNKKITESRVSRDHGGGDR